MALLIGTAITEIHGNDNDGDIDSNYDNNN